MRPASKIVLLPGIDRALVLSQSTASIFSLPEFAPMSGIGSLRDVNDLSRDIDERLSSRSDSDEAVVTAFTKTAIRLVRVQKSSLKLLRNVEYPQVLVGLQRSNFALVANATNYDLIDLENSQQIPLFPISTAEAEEHEEEVKPAAEAKETEGREESASPPPERKSTKVKPLIAAVGTDEFLVLSGSKTDEPAMGLVVNTEGNISRGTIAWPEYPSSVAVDYPYVASVIGTQVQFHSLHDQRLVQSIDFEDVPIVSNVLAGISQPYQPLVDKIRLVPLVSTDNESDRVEAERKTAERLSVISSSLFVYSKQRGVECLLSSPRIFYLERLVEQEKMDEVLEEMGTLEVTTERAVTELEYLNLLVGLGYLLHEDFSSAASTWQTGTLDPRLVVHIYDAASVVGELWVFNGILNIAKTILDKFACTRDSKKVKDQPESRQFYRYFLKDWLSKRDMESIADKKNVFHTTEKAYLKLILQLDASGEVKKKDVYGFIQNDIIESVEDAIATLAEAKRYYGKFLLYKRQGAVAKVCELWKQILVGDVVDRDFKGTEEQFAGYLTGQDRALVWEYGLWLADRSPSVGLKIFTSDNRFSDSELMTAFKQLENPQVWRQFLRVLVYDKKDRSFHGELVVVTVEDLQAAINGSAPMQAYVTTGTAKYRQLSLPKRGYYEYMVTTAGNPEQRKLVEMRQDLLRLLMEKDAGSSELEVVRQKLEGDQGLLALELCVVYSQLGQHERCLHKLCHGLQDFDQCIRYCEQGGSIVLDGLFSSSVLSSQSFPTGHEASETIQNELFSLLYDETLQLEPEAVQVACTRQLLELHGGRLDLKAVLGKTPSSWPLERLSIYLVNVLRHVMKDKSQSTFNRSLARAENLKVSLILKMGLLSIADSGVVWFFLFCLVTNIFFNSRPWANSKISRP